MPEHPSWDDLRYFASTLHDPDAGMTGIALRGLAGWGENLAPMSTVINTFGGCWFDMEWAPSLDSPEVHDAVSMYVDTLRSYGQPGAATSGFGECLTQFSQGNAAMWFDASSMVSGVENPDSSTVVGKTGYALGPTLETPYAGWLYAWALAIPETSQKKDAAWEFIAWMTHPGLLPARGRRARLGGAPARFAAVDLRDPRSTPSSPKNYAEAHARLDGERDPGELDDAGGPV